MVNLKLYPKFPWSNLPIESGTHSSLPETIHPSGLSTQASIYAEMGGGICEQFT